MKRDIKQKSALCLNQHRQRSKLGPNTRIFQCGANAIGQSPDVEQTSSGSSFIREPKGLPLIEAGHFQEQMITVVPDLARADRKYILDSLENPPFLREYWQAMIRDMKLRVDMKPE